MNICIIGSGGRESALAWKTSQSPHCNALFIIPGNAGTLSYGVNVDLDVRDFEKFRFFLLKNDISMVVVGPEQPLVDGLVDQIKSDDELRKVRVIGPSKEGAMLEGSKAFAKEFMNQYSIPTAAYQKFNETEIAQAVEYIESIQPPFVLKADGLAGGKGVLIIHDKEEAKAEAGAMLSGKFGQAGKTLVIEQFLDGIEFSVFVLTDGESFRLLPVAKDYKRRFEGDLGLNTGGMGAVSPVPFVDKNLMDKVVERIIKPTIHGLTDREIDYTGFIFFGLINVGGDPFVIEYNCRLGDPETEVVIPRLENDLVQLFASLFDQTLSSQKIAEKKETAVTVVLVSDGYPGRIQKGKIIEGIDKVDKSIVFHGGTRQIGEHVVTDGGRVMAITSFGSDKSQALERSVQSIGKIQFEGKQFRSDIGFDV